MSDRIQNNIKKSNFIASQDWPDGSYIDFVYNGTNIRIAKADFITAFGTFATLASRGEATAIPVYKKIADDEYIRTIQGGNGIVASESAEDGIQLDHTFTQDATGVTLCTNFNAAAPLFRSLVAGTGMQIAASGDTIVFNATGIPVASNIVIVNEMSDFPAPSAGVITLNDDTAYLVSAHLTTADRFVLGNNCVVYGADSAVASITYTGSGDMFTQTDGASKVTLIRLAAPNGTVFNISSTSGNGIFQFVNATVTECDYAGTIGTMNAMQITDVSFEDVKSGGFTFTGSVTVLIGERNLFIVNGGTMFDLDSVVFSAGFSMDACFTYLAAGTYFLDGDVDSGNMAVGATGSVLNCRFSGSGTPLNNIASYDDRWNMLANDSITDSIVSIQAITSSNTVSITAANTPVVVGSTWTFDHESRISGAATGRFTYTGTGKHVNIHATVTADSAGGTNDYTFYIYKNGVQEAGSAIQRAFTSGSPGNLSMLWQLDLEKDDYIELFVENNDNTINIEVIKAILTVDG